MKQIYALVLMIGLIVSLPAHACAKQKRKRKRPTKAKTVILPIERKQLLRAVTDSALKAELERRWLSIFTLKELQEEAARRGIQR